MSRRHLAGFQTVPQLSSRTSLCGCFASSFMRGRKVAAFPRLSRSPAPSGRKKWRSRGLERSGTSSLFRPLAGEREWRRGEMAMQSDKAGEGSFPRPWVRRSAELNVLRKFLARKPDRPVTQGREGRGDHPKPVAKLDINYQDFAARGGMATKGGSAAWKQTCAEARALYRRAEGAPEEDRRDRHLHPRCAAQGTPRAYSRPTRPSGTARPVIRHELPRPSRLADLAAGQEARHHRLDVEHRRAVDGVEPAHADA